MSAFQTTYHHHERIRSAVAAHLAAPKPKTWPELAATLMPPPRSGAPLHELRQYHQWVNFTCHTTRGHLERQLGRRHPELEAAQKAITDHAIRITMPIRLADISDRNTPLAQERDAREAAARAAEIANQPNADVTQRYPISGARPYHAGSIEADPPKLPHDGIPFALRNEALQLIGQLFTLTRDGRRQGIMKQSGMTVLRSLMLHFANGKTGLCYPSYEAVAANTGLGRSTVADAISVLSDIGFLEVTNRVKRVPIRGRSGTVLGSRPVQTSNSYRLGVGNWLAIAAAVPAAALGAVLAWLKKWRNFLNRLRELLLKMTESRTRTETNPDCKSEGNPPAEPPRPPAILRRLCRLRASLTPKISLHAT
jgi:hypothetical protein